MRSRDLVHKAITGVTIRSLADGKPVEITGKIVQGKGLVLYADGVETSLGVIEAQYGQSPLFDPKAEGLRDWYFEEC